jgi:hypothetical protein
MKVLKFKYTKKLDDVSERVFVPLSHPAQLYFGVDVSHLEGEEQTKAIQQLADVINARDQIINQKVLDLGLEKHYRSFMPARMGEIDISYKGNSCPELIAEKAANLKDSS